MSLKHAFSKKVVQDFLVIFFHKKFIVKFHGCKNTIKERTRWQMVIWTFNFPGVLRFILIFLFFIIKSHTRWWSNNRSSWGLTYYYLACGWWFCVYRGCYWFTPNGALFHLLLVFELRNSQSWLLGNTKWAVNHWLCSHLISLISILLKATENVQFFKTMEFRYTVDLLIPHTLTF